MKVVFAGMAMAALMLSSSCATYQPGDKAAEARLKRFSPIPGRASLYVCYERTVLPTAAKPRVWLGDINLGAVRENSFIHADVAPGRYSLRLFKDGPFGGRFTGELPIEAAPGQVLIYWVGMTGKGWGTFTIDAFNSDAEARACVTAAEYAVKAAGLE